MNDSYQLNEDFQVRDTGAELVFYQPARGSGTVLRGLGAALFRDIAEYITRGACTFDEIARAATVADADTCRDFLAVLRDKAILVPPRTAPAAKAAPSLADRRIGLWGSARLIERVASRLARFGPRELVADAALETELSQLDLVVCVDDRLDVRAHQALNRRAISARVRFLSARLVGASLALGPLVLPGKTACFDCYWQRLQAGAARPPAWVLDEAPVTRAVRADPLEDAVHAIAAEHVAIEIFHTLAGGAPPRCVGAIVEVDITELSARRRSLLELPGCHACALVGAIP